MIALTLLNCHVFLPLFFITFSFYLNPRFLCSLSPVIASRRTPLVFRERFPSLSFLSYLRDMTEISHGRQYERKDEISVIAYLLDMKEKRGGRKKRDMK